MEAFPFRMTALNMAKHRNNPNFAFWKMLKEGYDHFEATRQEPKVAVCEKRYVFDPAAPDNASRPLSFSPSGACPAYQIDKNIAEVVLDHRRQEQLKMAEYIAQGVATAAPHVGDGGMNSVFAAKLGVQDQFDDSGRTVQVARAPGALPRPGGIPATTVVAPEPQPVAVANVPEPAAAAQPKQAQPTSFAGMFGTMFGGATAQAKPAAPQTVALRGTHTEMAAKPRRNAGYRTASTSTASKPHEAAAKPKAVMNAEAKPAEAASPPPAPELRTAYSAARPSTNGLLAGAQPVVPVGSFDSRWSGFR
jgi:hypothetical protein